VYLIQIENLYFKFDIHYTGTCKVDFNPRIKCVLFFIIKHCFLFSR